MSNLLWGWRIPISSKTSNQPMSSKHRFVFYIIFVCTQLRYGDLVTYGRFSDSRGSSIDIQKAVFGCNILTLIFGLMFQFEKDDIPRYSLIRCQ